MGSTDSDRGEISYILLYQAESFGVSELENGNQVAKMIARGRGKSEEIDIIEEDGETKYVVISEQGFVSTNSGYMMSFIDEKHTDLSIIDLAQLGEYRSYRVTEGAVDSLPVNILSRLDQQEYVRIHGRYDSDKGEFRDIGMGWEIEDKNTWDRLMEEIRGKNEVRPIIDFLVAEHGPDHWTTESIADARGVKPKTVRNNIRSVDSGEVDE